MTAFKEGDKVKLKKVTLHKGVFVHASTVLTVQKVDASGEAPVYELFFKDKEMMPQTMEAVPESEIQAAQ